MVNIKVNLTTGLKRRVSEELCALYFCRETTYFIPMHLKCICNFLLNSISKKKGYKVESCKTGTIFYAPSFKAYDEH